MHTETFSYIPPLTDNEIKEQVKFILKNNWIPGIEYSNELDSKNSYWNFWKLPMFSASTAEEVLAEVEDCKAKNAKAYVRVTGYDSIRQGQVHSFIVYKPK